MSHIQDRFYTYLISGLHQNSDPGKKYFFDRDDSTLFVLGFKSGQYRIHDKIPQFQTAEIKEILNEKIAKVTLNDKSILELKNLPNAVKIDYSTPNRTEESFKHLMKLEKEQFDLTQEFIQKNQIDIGKANVIE